MAKIRLILLVIFLVLAKQNHLIAQSPDLGLITSMSLSKNIGRDLGVKFEQELRFNQNLTAYDRSLTSIKLDYSIFRKLIMAEIEYDFVHQRQTDIFEFRHRTSLGLSTFIEYNSLEFEFRTRGQATWRDENRGDYKFNPKYVWRNKLECAYKIFGSPLKPYISGEVFCPVNSPYGFYMDGFRIAAGAKYRINSRNSIQLFVRYDQDVQQPNPKAIMYGGVGWNYKL
jgi:hypothetical protein